MGLAETSDGDSWRVRCDFESILRAMQRANDRQKMLAAHGALLSDERLQLVVEDLRKLKLLEGRVVLHGEEEAGREAGGSTCCSKGPTADFTTSTTRPKSTTREASASSGRTLSFDCAECLPKMAAPH